MRRGERSSGVFSCTLSVFGLCLSSCSAPSSTPASQLHYDSRAVCGRLVLRVWPYRRCGCSLTHGAARWALPSGGCSGGASSAVPTPCPVWLGGLALVRCRGRAWAGTSKQVLKKIWLMIVLWHLALQPEY